MTFIYPYGSSSTFFGSMTDVWIKGLAVPSHKVFGSIGCVHVNVYVYTVYTVNTICTVYTEYTVYTVYTV